MPHILPDAAVTNHSTWNGTWPFSRPIKRERTTSDVRIIQELEASNLDEPRFWPPTAVQG
ncbi:hypothetical protein IFM47457_00651 [Aspergillus lentulus]|nr:hypothetical protein IFM47457_00651 [Aspergillus lentulus]